MKDNEMLSNILTALLRTNDMLDNRLPTNPAPELPMSPRLCGAFVTGKPLGGRSHYCTLVVGHTAPHRTVIGGQYVQWTNGR